jgi:hypothetical protein
MLVFQAPIIATATVSGSPATGATTISLSGYSEDETPDAYYTVIVGSSAGNDDGGKVRLRSVNDGGSSIKVAVNNIEWPDYPYVSILKEILPWSILPDLGNDRMDADIAYDDENENWRPLARIGPPSWGYVDVATRFHSKSLAWDGSAKVFNSNNVASHSWAFPSGSPSSSSSEGTVASPIEVTWNTKTGHNPKYIKYTVTDASGFTHTRYNPHWVIEDFTTDCYCDIEIESCSGDYSAGTWDARIKVRSNATSSDFPSDAMIVIIAEDYYNGEKVSIGGNWEFREDVVFMGWIVRGTTFQDAETGYVTFDVSGTIGKAAQLTDWPANLEYKSNPSAWNQLKNMTCDLAAIHILTQRTTLDHIVDITPMQDSKILRYVDIPETDVATQLDDYCLSPRGGKALSDRQGQIYFSRNPNLRPLSERTSITEIGEFDLDDLRSDPGLELAIEEQEPQVAQVDFIGFTYDGNDVTPLYSLAPEWQFHTGRVEKVDGVRADSQSEANTLAGMYLANFNNIWTQVRCPFFNYRIFDIAPEHYATLSLAATDTERGIVWSSQKLLARSVDITYSSEDESIEVEVIFEKDSFGPPGVGGGYSKEPPRRSSSPAPAPEIEAPALATWSSFYIRKGGDAQWNERGDRGVFNGGCVDPWWFTDSKANSTDPDKAIVYGCGDDGVLQRSTNAGQTWSDVTLIAPPDTWTDTPAPTIDDIDLVWVEGDYFQNGRFYVLASWQNDSDQWRGWICITDDDFQSYTWYALYDDGGALPDEVRPLGVEANKENVLVTVWTDDILQLQLWDPLPFAYGGEHDLGSALTAEVPGTYTAYPKIVLDDPQVWFVFGRMQGPQGLSDPSHIIKYNGSWSEVESSWTTSICGSFDTVKLDDGRREYYAVRNI